MVWRYLKRSLKALIAPLVSKNLWRFVVELQSATRPLDRLAERGLLEKWRVARVGSVRRTGENIGFGVNLVGYLRAISGLGEAARSSIIALKAAQIPLALNEYRFNAPPDQDAELLEGAELTRGFEYNTNLLHVNPPQMPYLWESFGKRLADIYTIGAWYWEMPEFPDEWCKCFEVVDEIWVATNFIKDAISAKSPVPVVLIPPALEVEYMEDTSRADFGLPDDTFLFLCSFDVRSIQDRKNPEGTIQAFIRAFTPEVKSVGLVVKITNSMDNSQGVRHLKDALEGYSNCFFIEETYSRKKFNALLGLMDVYVSLHRSEGFGLIGAEAMYLGKPVVMTNWSGNVDFATPENSCPVDFQLIPVGTNIGPYGPHQYWADPDIEQAAESLRKLCSDRAYYRRISAEAARTIRTNYSPETVGAAMKNRLREIGRW